MADLDSITTVTSRDEFAATAAEAPDGARVPVEVRVTVEDPFVAYRRARSGPDGCYLATTGGQSGWGYFAVEPEYWTTVTPESETSSFDAIGELLAEEQLVRGDCAVPYPCGAFGWLSYDVAREIETLPDTTEDDRGLPRIQFGTYSCVAAWEEPRSEPTTLHVTACPRITDDASVSDHYERALDRARSLAERAVTGTPADPAPPVSTSSVEFTSETGKESYAERVRAIKQYVRDGDTFQVNVSQRLAAPAAVHPVATFDALRRINPAPYSALLEFPGVDLVSASPELLLDVDGEALLTEPIAGTRPRGETDAADETLERDLLDNKKERAEHAMLVDLERNDLGKVAEYGSVEVEEYRRVDRYSEVMHLVSAVVGDRRDDATLADAIEAVFPGGTITGAPKPRTMEIIDELETTRRGPYTGSIGVLGFDERTTLNMTIRTLVRTGDTYHLRVGAGVVHDSDPVAEFEETMDKGRALINAIDDALGEQISMDVSETAPTNHP